MIQADQTKADPIVRRAATARAAVLVVALLGVECAIPAASLGERLHRAPAVALRSVTPSSPTVLTNAAGIATLALILMLLFGGQHFDASPRSTAARTITCHGDSDIDNAVRRRHAVSYRTGGLYGP